MWISSRVFRLLLNINMLSVFWLTGTEGAKWDLRRVANPGSGITSERSIRNYLGGDKDHIALKRGSNLEAGFGHRLHTACTARTCTPFFADIALDQTLIPRTDFVSPRAGRFEWAQVCLSEVPLDEGWCRHAVAQGLPQAIAAF